MSNFQLFLSMQQLFYLLISESLLPKVAAFRFASSTGGLLKVASSPTFSSVASSSISSVLVSSSDIVIRSSFDTGVIVFFPSLQQNLKKKIFRNLLKVQHHDFSFKPYIFIDCIHQTKSQSNIYNFYQSILFSTSQTTR